MEGFDAKGIYMLLFLEKKKRLHLERAAHLV